MGLEKFFFEGLLGPLGRKAAQWIPSKEGIMRGKIKKYEDELKKLEKSTWTADIGREHDRISNLLRTEKENLDRYLATDR